MGHAAYRRGSHHLARQLTAEQRAPEFLLMEELNALPKYPDAGRPFGSIQYVASHHGWWATCPVTGSGFWYPTLREAVRRWQVTIVEYDHGTWKAVPTPRETAP